jgi:hypothetical protein
MKNQTPAVSSAPSKSERPFASDRSLSEGENGPPRRQFAHIDAVGRRRRRLTRTPAGETEEEMGEMLPALI